MVGQTHTQPISLGWGIVLMEKKILTTMKCSRSSTSLHIEPYHKVLHLLKIDPILCQVACTSDDIGRNFICIQEGINE